MMRLSHQRQLSAIQAREESGRMIQPGPGNQALVVGVCMGGVNETAVPISSIPAPRLGVSGAQALKVGTILLDVPILLRVPCIPAAIAHVLDVLAEAGARGPGAAAVVGLPVGRGLPGVLAVAGAALRGALGGLTAVAAVEAHALRAPRACAARSEAEPPPHSPNISALPASAPDSRESFASGSTAGLPSSIGGQGWAGRTMPGASDGARTALMPSAAHSGLAPAPLEVLRELRQGAEADGLLPPLLEVQRQLLQRSEVLHALPLEIAARLLHRPRGAPGRATLAAPLRSGARPALPSHTGHARAAELRAHHCGNRDVPPQPELPQ
eukprot:CAMPEP_0179107754 /NCGR_PEP_ID=MMETSP0796-20121207/50163_1 /TAXON_ID=73915 /ORGANISM="Pyrodinium bahamense, Strain pbaha01" /LENGTH=325 /DNA_ID=CAMNT_0020805815 /DNA_START=68 /DNA_END=1044 /DNA_ORIENTATION=-